jgi:hypothetical protein
MVQRRKRVTLKTRGISLHCLFITGPFPEQVAFKIISLELLFAFIFAGTAFGAVFIDKNSPQYGSTCNWTDNSTRWSRHNFPANGTNCDRVFASSISPGDRIPPGHMYTY